MIAVPTATRRGAIWLMPSAWGLLTWSVWLGLYLARLIRWDPVSMSAVAVFSGVAVAYAASLLLLRRWFAALPSPPVEPSDDERASGSALIVMHVIGFAGIVIYAHRSVTGVTFKGTDDIVAAIRRV